MLLLHLCATHRGCYSHCHLRGSAKHVAHRREYEAVRHAQINAIAREFGTIVTSESHNYMRENNSISSDDFFSYGEMDVRGEWLETIGDTIWQPARREGGMVVYDVS